MERLRAPNLSRVEADLAKGCRGHLRRRLLHQHRYADGASPANNYSFYFRWSDIAAQLGVSDEIRTPPKLGFKDPKFVVALSVTNDYPGGFWEDYGYNWFSGS
jgi:hypothetical protein